MADPQTLPPGVARRLITAVRAKNKGEAFAIWFTRRAFVDCVVTDQRTRDVFARWRRDSKLDLVVAEWSAQLDAAAARLRLAHRSVLLDHPAEWDLLPTATRAIFAECARLCELRLRNSQSARTADVDGFVCTVLYRNPPPIRAWLGLELLDAFDAELRRDIRGDETTAIDPTVDVLAALPKGLRPKGDGAHLARDARWHYEMTVHVPPSPPQELAATYIEARRALGPLKGTKDSGDDGRTVRVDDSLVRKGAANAQRLLELTVPPDQWNRFDALFRRRHRKQGAHAGRGRR